jgi:hypothetical protein
MRARLQQKQGKHYKKQILQPRTEDIATASEEATQQLFEFLNCQKSCWRIRKVRTLDLIKEIYQILFPFMMN